MAHGVGAADWGEGRKRGVSWTSVRRILAYARPYKSLIAATFVLVLVAAALGLVPPLLIRRAIDTAIPQGDKRELVILVLGMVAMPVVVGLVQVAQNWGNTIIGNRMMLDVRKELFAHMLRMPLRFYTMTRAGDITTRLTNDVNGIQQVVTTSFTNVMANAVTVGTTVGLMFWLDWRLTLVSVVVLPFFVFGTVKVGDLRFQVARRVQAALGEMTALIQEKLNISGLVLIKTFGREPQETTRFNHIAEEVMKGQITQSMVGRWFFMFSSLFGTVSPALIYGYGGWLTINGGMSLGEVVAFVALVNRLFMPVSQLLTVHVDLAGSVALFERIFDYLDRSPEIDEKPEALDLPSASGLVEYGAVSFGYEAGQPVLQEVSFRAEPGQLIALVGPSGAGKTTVTYLLPRLYDPQSGAVRIDGHDVRDLKLAALSANIGMVTQETFLFHASVRDNLRYAKPGATDDEIEAAAKAAHIHEVIVAMPRGYDTLVGERGYRLSGGEKQRLAIARIILKDPRILVLDEATSSLDSHSERLIKEALEPLLRTRTSLVIAHRLSTILAADQILVMDGGRIVERGRHDELVALRGLYARLYHEQFKDGTVAVDTPLVDEAEPRQVVAVALSHGPTSAHAGASMHGNGAPTGGATRPHGQ
jgi:ATP-binding cassette subfamily B protein